MITQQFALKKNEWMHSGCGAMWMMHTAILNHVKNFNI